VNVQIFRAVIAAFALAIVTATVQAAWSSEPVPLPREHPTRKAIKPHKAAAAKPAAPLSLAPQTAPVGALPANAPAASAAVQTPASAKPIVPPRTAPAFAIAPTVATSPLDLSAVKQAIDLVRKNRQDEATTVESSITDPLARKLVEWVILRSEDGSSDFSRYKVFIAANPSWPSIPLLRRRAEATLWQNPPDPQTVIAFFAEDPPRSAKGHFALARALLMRGDAARASAILHGRCGAHGCPALCRGRGCGITGRTPSRRHRNGRCQGAHCGDRSSGQREGLT
jgi:soluble lytic murein transglycosylase